MKKFWLLALSIFLCSQGAIGCAPEPEEKDKIKVTLPDKLPASPDWESIYEQNIRSVPQIVIEQCRLSTHLCQEYSHGTAFVVDQGVVATNYHLAEYYYLTEYSGSDTIFYQIYLRYPAITASEGNYFLADRYYVTGCYPIISRDLALLKVETLGNVPVTITSGDFWDLQPDDQILIVSYPGSSEFVGSEGEIYDLFLNQGLADWIINDTKLIEHTADTYFGSSGGPVFNDKGEIIGIHFAGYEDNSYLSLALSITYLQGINFGTLLFD